MKKFYIIIYICLMFDLMAVASSQLDKVIVKGEVINFTDKSANTITAIDCNPWDEISSRNAVRIDSTGRFKTYVSIPYGHNFTVYYDKAYLCQYAEPGDTIYMVIDANDIRSGARYSGSHAELNNQYGKAYAKLFNSFFEQEPPGGQMNKDEYTKIFRDIHHKNLNNINHFADSVGMDDNARDLLVRSALFSLANSAIDHKDETPEKVLSFFADSMFELDNDANIREMMFPYHLNAYLRRLEDVVTPASTKQMIEAIMARHPKSLNRDIMMAICLKDMNVDAESTKLPRDIFYDDTIYELVYRKSDENIFLSEITDAKGSIYVWENGDAVVSNYTDLTELLSKEYTGKVVYLDLWATWCGPCVEANKFLPEVADFFKEEDVVFVSVAMKSDFEKWKKHASERPANCRDYFINDDDDAELIMSKYRMSGYPAFRIIGKDSKIINADPPRPNSPAVYDTLLRILN